uniref:Heat shock protein 67B2 n=2 Tax=Schistocephalus solidus TaxID=70667 RepID=A0A0X3Q225_SCHSO
MLLVQRRIAALCSQFPVQSLRWLAVNAFKQRENSEKWGPKPGSSESEVNWAKLKQLQACSSPSELVVIDVRSENEALEDGLLKDAINIPLDDLFYAFLLPEDKFLQNYGCRKPHKDTKIVLYCNHNRKSRLARKKLEYFGIPGCICLSGGTAALKKDEANG